MCVPISIDFILSLNNLPPISPINNGGSSTCNGEGRFTRPYYIKVNTDYQFETTGYLGLSLNENTNSRTTLFSGFGFRYLLNASGLKQSQGVFQTWIRERRPEPMQIRRS